MIQLLQFIFGLIILIFVHELGHFLASKALKVEVEEFGFGFPPRLMKLFEYKGTAYTLNWIPLGGFVRPKGENDPTVKGGLAAASPWVRLGVYFAGPVMNILVGILLAVILFYNSGERVTNQVLVQSVSSGSPAEITGMLPGDLFVSVGGETIDNIEKLQAVVAENLGKPITVVLVRDGQEVTLTLTPRENPPEGQGPLGIVLENPTRPISLLTAISRGTTEIFNYIRSILLLPIRLIQGQLTPQESRVVGYKGMYDIYQQVQNPLTFFIAITISLGVMNLLPIPALDGGRILLTMPEIILRKRIPARYENAIHFVGFALLVLLLIYVNLQDFINPVTIPK